MWYLYLSDTPLSHLETAWLVTPSEEASSSWVIPFSRRRRESCCCRWSGPTAAMPQSPFHEFVLRVYDPAAVEAMANLLEEVLRVQAGGGRKGVPAGRDGKGKGEGRGKKAADFFGNPPPGVLSSSLPHRPADGAAPPPPGENPAPSAGPWPGSGDVPPCFPPGTWSSAAGCRW